jgi:hypothetical protein
MKITVDELGVKSNLCRWKTVKEFWMIQVYMILLTKTFQIKKTWAFYHACDLSYLTVKFHTLKKNRLYFRRPLYVQFITEWTARGSQTKALLSSLVSDARKQVAG